MRPCYGAGMPPLPVSLWATDDRECVLQVVDGRRELFLRVNGRTVRLHTCIDAAAVRRLAARWLEEFPPGALTEK
jgi:hypothetical protein